jgi:hypothetical protein
MAMGTTTRHRVRPLPPTQTRHLKPASGPGADTPNQAGQPNPHTNPYTNAPRHTRTAPADNTSPEPAPTLDNPRPTETLG